MSQQGAAVAKELAQKGSEMSQKGVAITRDLAARIEEAQAKKDKPGLAEESLQQNEAGVAYKEVLCHAASLSPNHQPTTPGPLVPNSISKQHVSVQADYNAPFQMPYTILFFLTSFVYATVR